MEALVLGLIGIPVGVLLDVLAVRLAIRPRGSDEPLSDDAGLTPQPSLAHGETGSLVVQDEQSGRPWARRLLIVAATVGLFAIAGARTDEMSHLPIMAAYISVFLLCASTDILSFRVPNVVTYPAIVGAIIVGFTMPDADIAEVAAGGLLAGGVLFLPALFTGGVGMGMGDVKLALVSGLALGFAHVVPAMLVMALGGGAVAALLLVTGLRQRGEPIPYAPFISGGALVALLWQGPAFAQFV